MCFPEGPYTRQEVGSCTKGVTEKDSLLIQSNVAKFFTEEAIHEASLYSCALVHYQNYCDIKVIKMYHFSCAQCAIFSKSQNCYFHRHNVKEVTHLKTVFIDDMISLHLKDT